MDINAFRAHFKYGGARASQFRISLTNPIDGSADNDLQFLAHASALPESYVDKIRVPFYGRSINVAGRKQYQDWNVRIYNDEDFKIRNALESWNNFINTPETNVRAGASSEVSAYKSVGQVEQLSQTGTVLRTYRFIGIFPTVISPIQLDWGSDDVQSFDVTFAYDYFDLIPGITGDGGYI